MARSRNITYTTWQSKLKEDWEVLAMTEKRPESYRVAREISDKFGEWVKESIELHQSIPFNKASHEHKIDALIFAERNLLRIVAEVTAGKIISKRNTPTIESQDRIVQRINALGDELRAIYLTLNPNRPDFMSKEQWTEIAGEKE